jgi:putative endonuclease
MTDNRSYVISYSCDCPKYRVERLVYYERFMDIRAAIAREKELKGWRRDKKIALIRSKNPTWIDLAEQWGNPVEAVTGPYINSDG